MKSYEELLSDIEEDMELMGASHIVYSAEENGVITDYDYLPVRSLYDFHHFKGSSGKTS